MSIVRWRTPNHVPAVPSVVESVNRLFDDFLLRPFPFLEPLESRGPAVDVYETDSEVVVKAELPGIARDQIELHIEGDMLTLRGEVRSSDEVKEDGYHRREIRYGTFHRMVPLPVPVKQEGITAKFEDGVLTVRAPKAEESTIGKKIAIE